MHKVPTTIAYDANGIPSNWGFRNTASQDTLKWFKLLLIDKQDLPVHLRWATELEEARGLMKKLKKNAVEVISEYLRLLWADASKQISQLHGAPFMRRVKTKLVATLQHFPLYMHSFDCRKPYPGLGS